MSAPSVTLEGVTVRYGSRVAVRAVSTELPGGLITAVVGPSGCGKTSLLHAINRLHAVEGAASVEGVIRVGGEVERDDRRLRRRVGLIFQRPNVFPASVGRNVSLALEHHREGTRAEIAARVESSLRQVGLWDELGGELSRPAEALSGGQQQRLCIARALALRPDVLLMDEPCSALDPLATARVESVLTALKGSLTVVLVTHNLAQARRVGDELRVLWPEDGGVLKASGPAAKVFAGTGVTAVDDYLSGRAG